MTEALERDTVLKAYVILVSVNVDFYATGRQHTMVEEYLNATRSMFSDSKFEDHLNAPCMTIILPVTGKPSSIEFLEFFPDSNKPFNSDTFEFKGKKPAFLEQLAKFMQEVENHEQ